MHRHRNFAINTCNLQKLVRKSVQMHYSALITTYTKMILSLSAVTVFFGSQNIKSKYQKIFFNMFSCVQRINKIFRYPYRFGSGQYELVEVIVVSFQLTKSIC